MTNNDIAAIILAQLGANKFIAMTGAKNIAAAESALHFRLPNNFAKDKINDVRITLNADDLYDMEFFYTRGATSKKVAQERGVFASELRPVFTAVTGLDTHL